MMMCDTSLIKDVLAKIEQSIGYLRAANISVPPDLERVVILLQGQLGMKSDLPTTRPMGQS
jgi:hypothetical protein